MQRVTYVVLAIVVVGGCSQPPLDGDRRLLGIWQSGDRNDYLYIDLEDNGSFVISSEDRRGLFVRTGRFSSRGKYLILDAAQSYVRPKLGGEILGGWKPIQVQSKLPFDFDNGKLVIVLDGQSYLLAQTGR